MGAPRRFRSSGRSAREDEAGGRAAQPADSPLDAGGSIHVPHHLDPYDAGPCGRVADGRRRGPAGGRGPAGRRRPEPSLLRLYKGKGRWRAVGPYTFREAQTVKYDYLNKGYLAYIGDYKGKSCE
jgi:hypothetical protein